MAYIELDFESQYYGGNTQVSILLPDRDRAVTNKEFYESGRKYPVLWLLHGTHGDHTDWLRKSMVEVYAREREIIVVMPSAANSDYTDWPGFGTGYDSFRMVMEMHAAGTLPKLYFCIGTEDFLYDQLYVPFKKACMEKGVDILFEEVPGFGHEWRFWDPQIEKAMDFFGVPKSPHADSYRGLKGRKFI